MAYQCESNRCAEFGEAAFLVTVHELKEYMSVKDDFRSREQSLEFIDVVDEDNNGHDIDDLRKKYDEVSLFVIDLNSAHFDTEMSSIGARALASTGALRSPIFDIETGDAVSDAIGRAGCSTDNVFQILTASQWRHAFCIFTVVWKALFPWMRDLSNWIDRKTSFWHLRDECRSQLGWHAREMGFLCKLFECTDDHELRDIEKSIEVFKDLVSRYCHNRLRADDGKP